MKSKLIYNLVVASACIAGADAAVISSITGGDDLTNLTLGVDVTDLTTTSSNDNFDVYLEQVNVAAGVTVLLNDIAMDGTILTTATSTTFTENFDVIYLNFFTGSTTEITGSITFNGNILGIAGTNGFNGSATALNSTDQFEVAGVTYRSGETDGIQEGTADNYSFVGNTLTFDPARAGAAGADNIRIFIEQTAPVPEPSSIALLGLGGLALLGRRKR